MDNQTSDGIYCVSKVLPCSSGKQIIQSFKQSLFCGKQIIGLIYFIQISMFLDSN